MNVDTKLADRTATQQQAQPSDEQAASSPSVSTKTLRPGTPKGKGSPSPQDTALPGNLAQIRAELASTQKTRGELETKVSDLTTELSAFKMTDTEQKRRISQLEKAKELLERRMKDRADELKGKGRFVENVQDEILALTLQLNMSEQEKEKLKNENEELTKRWVAKMEDEASRMNDQMGWEDARRRR